MLCRHERPQRNSGILPDRLEAYVTSLLVMCPHDRRCFVDEWPQRYSGILPDRLEAYVTGLLERQLYAFFFHAGHKFVLRNNSRTRVPAQQGVVVTGRTDCFGFFKPAHRFAK